MCGRTACTLAPEDICRSCKYTSKDGKTRQPRWQDPPGGQYKYYQSYNVAPGSHTPVMLSKKHVKDIEPKEVEADDSKTMVEDESEFVVQPMRWGLVPHWHKGDPKSVDYSMINARSDGMLSKTTFKRPLEKGRRCVILVDGYFEWQTKDGKKQPYYIHFPQQETISETAEQKPEVDTKETKTETEEPTEPGTKKLLTLAGLFDVWHSPETDVPLYSYSIITVDAHQSLSFIHHRMPAVLSDEEEVRQWLDFGDVPLSKATSLIRPNGSISFYPVTKDVGNVKNKSENNIKPIDLSKPPQTGSSKMMMAWLSKGAKKTEKRSSPDRDVAPGSEEPDVKKVKTEDA